MDQEDEKHKRLHKSQAMAMAFGVEVRSNDDLPARSVFVFIVN